MGANWVGPSQDHIYELVKEFGLELQSQFDSGKNILDLNGDLSVYEGNIGELTMFGRPAGPLFPNRLPKFKVLTFGNEEMDAAYKQLDAMALTIDPLRPEAHPDADKFDHTSYSEWIDANVKNEGAKNMMRWFTKGSHSFNSLKTARLNIFIHLSLPCRRTFRSLVTFLHLLFTYWWRISKARQYSRRRSTRIYSRRIATAQ